MTKIRYKSEEVEDWKWMAIDDVKDDMQAHPEIYTVWFKIIFDEFYHFRRSQNLIVSQTLIFYLKSICDF
jgi:isopentenyldiphosphate isomerase